MKTPLLLTVVSGLAASLACGQNLLVNPGFDMGANNLDGYEAFAAWSKGADGFSSPWGLADAPVVAPGDGTAVFAMNTQLAAADPFWSGATQAMTLQQNFWTVDNTASVPAGALNYGDTFTFSGNAAVSEAYAPGNVGLVFIQFLDKGWGATFFESIDVSTLPADGFFSLSTTIPADASLNIVQVGFRNSGIEGTAGEMTISNLSVTLGGITVIPEPSMLSLLGGVLALAFVARRRR
jgi:hypothetical protein